MLYLNVPIVPEGWDEKKEEFVEAQYKTIQLEHSLVSLHKWESKWHKPFFGKDEKTIEETIDYIRCMTITQNVKPEVYNHLSADNVRDVNAYIDNPMTATTFSDISREKNKEIITAEIIYYWMIALNIPQEYKKWHLNSLLTLIRVCNIKNSPPKKTSKRELTNRYAQMNAERRKKYNTKG